MQALPQVDGRKTVSWVWCEDCAKRKYPSRKNAHLAMKKAKNSVKVYRCPRGTGWHVTHRRSHD